jgi:hypothetical protein
MTVGLILRAAKFVAGKVGKDLLLQIAVPLVQKLMDSKEPNAAKREKVVAEVMKTEKVSESAARLLVELAVQLVKKEEKKP